MMIIKYLLQCCFFLPCVVGIILHGFKRYTTYNPGSMGIIITVAHGGLLDPAYQVNGDIWPMRTNGCENALGECLWTHSCNKKSIKCQAKTLTDDYTLTIVRDIADEIRNLTGLQPHVVHNNLRRIKLDVNREVNQATFNIPDAVTAYHDYANFIKQAKTSIAGPGLLLDIHGQTHLPPGGEWIELGYLLAPENLNGNFWKTQTSISHLGKRLCGLEPNLNNPCFKDLIRGTNRSLGHFMNVRGLRAVPSPHIPTPWAPLLYYTGGYTIQAHGSKYKGDIDAIQLELPRHLRVSWPKDKLALVSAILCFYRKNYDTSLRLRSTLKCEKIRPTFEETENVVLSENSRSHHLVEKPTFEETERDNVQSRL